MNVAPLDVADWGVATFRPRPCGGYLLSKVAQRRMLKLWKLKLWMLRLWMLR